jgi:uncharacterized membrane protein
MTITEKPLPKKADSATKPVPSAIASIQAFAGPVPHPDILQKYEQLFPGISQRYLEEPLNEANHRRTCEKQHLEATVSLSKRGQWMAYSLALISVVGAFALIFLGFGIAGLSTFFGSIAAFVGVFIWGRSREG